MLLHSIRPKVINDTLETAITWERFENSIKRAALDAVIDHGGTVTHHPQGLLSWRLD